MKYLKSYKLFEGNSVSGLDQDVENQIFDILLPLEDAGYLISITKVNLGKDISTETSNKYLYGYEVNFQKGGHFDLVEVIDELKMLIKYLEGLGFKCEVGGNKDEVYGINLDLDDERFDIDKFNLIDIIVEFNNN